MLWRRFETMIKRGCTLFYLDSFGRQGCNRHLVFYKTAAIPMLEFRHFPPAPSEDRQRQQSFLTAARMSAALTVTAFSNSALCGWGTSGAATLTIGPSRW